MADDSASQAACHSDLVSDDEAQLRQQAQLHPVTLEPLDPSGGAAG
jgi:hypothetical protein